MLGWSRIITKAFALENGIDSLTNDKLTALEYTIRFFKSLSS